MTSELTEFLLFLARARFRRDAGCRHESNLT